MEEFQSQSGLPGENVRLFARGKVQFRCLILGVKSTHYHVWIAMSSSGLRRQETVVLEDRSRSPSYFFNSVLVKLTRLVLFVEECRRAKKPESGTCRELPSNKP